MVVRSDGTGRHDGDGVDRILAEHAVEPHPPDRPGSERADRRCPPARACATSPAGPTRRSSTTVPDASPVAINKGVFTFGSSYHQSEYAPIHTGDEYTVNLCGLSKSRTVKIKEQKVKEKK